jgi:hypothetical protein
MSFCLKAPYLPKPNELLEAIKKELARARDRFGHGDIEILQITGSWGTTMDDHEVLEALRTLNRRGSMFDDNTDSAD